MKEKKAWDKSKNQPTHSKIDARKWKQMTMQENISILIRERMLYTTTES